MIKKEVLLSLNKLNNDELNDKIIVYTQILKGETCLNDFLVCCGDFSRSISNSLTSLSIELLNLSQNVMVLWIKLLIEQPKIQMKYYDLLILKFLDGLYYATDERIQIFIDHIVDIIKYSYIFITRHLSQLIHVLSFHIPTHNLFINPIITNLLESVQIPELLWDDLVVFLYLQYHFSKGETQKMSVSITKGLGKFNRLITVHYVKVFLRSLNIEDENYYKLLI